MSTVNSTKAVKKAKVGYPKTPTQLHWEVIKASYGRADRGTYFKDYLEANVYLQNAKGVSRYDAHMYEPSKYIGARNNNKLKGQIYGKLLSGKEPSSSAIRDFNVLHTRDREVMAERLANAGVVRWGQNFMCPLMRYVTSDAVAILGVNGEKYNPECESLGLVCRSKVMGGLIPTMSAVKICTRIMDEAPRNYDRATEEWALANGYMLFGQRGVYYMESVAEQLGFHLYSNSNGHVVGEYHSSKKVVCRIPSVEYDRRKTPLLLGLELEVELKSDSMDKEAVALEWMKMLGFINTSGKKYRYCAVERDGSVPLGFEMVTSYTGLDVHAKALEPLKASPFKGKLRSHDTTTCGLHVHIDRAGITPFHADKLNFFVNDKQNRNLVLAVARRYGSERYCMIKEEHALDSDAAKMGRYVQQLKEQAYSHNKKNQIARIHAREIITAANSGRYQAINFTPDKTIEFRVYRGSLKYETIMSCLEFTRAAWMFSYTYSRAEMTTEKFLEFICKPENRKDTLFLRPYLTAKGFKTKERSEFVVPDKRLTNFILQAEDAEVDLERKPQSKERIAHNAVSA